jgi:arylformamidase
MSQTRRGQHGALRVKPLIAVLAVASVGGVPCLPRSAGAAPEGDCGSAHASVARGITYVDDLVSNLQRLDVYTPERSGTCPRAPVVMWIHGGGWARGDKRRVGDKARFFNDLGYVFVSVNYRLSAPPGDPTRPVHPAHAQDVGAAVAWVQGHAKSYGGDGRRIALLGHSAGAHLVALVGTDPDYIEDVGGGFGSLRCVGSYDTEAYDVVARAGGGSRAHTLIENAFGPDEVVWRDASPVNHLREADRLPRFQIVVRGTTARRQAEAAFGDAVRAAGATTEVIDAATLSHEQVNRRIGAPGDTVMTPRVKAFVTSCLGKR